MPPTPSWKDFTVHPSLSSFTSTPQAYLTAHPNLNITHLAVSALVFDHPAPPAAPTPRRILLLQRAPTDTLPHRWEVPGGACDAADESVLHALARELWEETGLRAARVVRRVGGLQVFQSRAGRGVGRVCFLVEVECGAGEGGGVEVRLEPREHQDFVWANEEEVRAGKVGGVELEFTAEEVERTVILAFQEVNEN